MRPVDPKLKLDLASAAIASAAGEHIGHVFRARRIAQVLCTIVGLVIVTMGNVQPGRARPDERFGYQPVHRDAYPLLSRVEANSYKQVSERMGVGLQDASRRAYTA